MFHIRRQHVEIVENELGIIATSKWKLETKKYKKEQILQNYEFHHAENKKPSV